MGRSDRSCGGRATGNSLDEALVAGLEWATVGEANVTGGVGEALG